MRTAPRAGNLLAVDPDRETVRIGMQWRILMTVCAAILAVAALLLAGMFVWIGAWPVAVLALPIVGGMALLCARASRCRLEFRPDELLVANQLRTEVVHRNDLASVEQGRSSNPLGVAHTAVLRLSSGRLVRVDAASHMGSPGTQQTAVMDKLTSWLDAS